MKKSVLLLGLILAGCAQAPDGSRVSIEFWTIQLKPVFTDYIEGLIARYEREHPNIRVVWVDVPFSGVKEKLMTSYLAGAPPDVVNLNVDLAMSLAALGALVDVEREAPAAARRDFIAGVWQATRIGDCVYALPWYLATNITIYNKAIFSQAGRPPPRDFSGLEAAAKAVKERTGKFIMCPKIGKDSDLLKLFAMEGVEVLEDGRTRIANAACRGILEFWKRLFKENHIPRASVTDDHRTALNMYIREETAIFFSGPQFLKTIRENNPDLYRRTAVAPPMVGRAGVSDIDVMVIAVTRASRHRKSAVDFAVFVTNAQNQLAFCRLVPILPSVKSALRDPLFSSPGPDLESRARVLAAQSLLKSKPLITGLKNLTQVQTILQEMTEMVFFDKKDPQSALEDAEARINQVTLN